MGWKAVDEVSQITYDVHTNRGERLGPIPPSMISVVRSYIEPYFDFDLEGARDLDAYLLETPAMREAVATEISCDAALVQATTKRYQQDAQDMLIH
jgi:hypothetical protein